MAKTSLSANQAQAVPADEEDLVLGVRLILRPLRLEDEGAKTRVPGVEVVGVVQERKIRCRNLRAGEVQGVHSYILGMTHLSFPSLVYSTYVAMLV